MNIVVIVVTYNGAVWVKKCFDSLFGSSVKLTVIAIDNNSVDGTADIIAESYPQVLLIRSENNLGFGKANNIGLLKAVEQNADYVFLLNQDAWVERTAIEKLVALSSENPEYGVLSPVHLNGAGDALDYNYSTYIAASKCPGFVSDLVLSTVKPLYDVAFVNAAAWLITKSCLDVVGGFNPIFPHYGEDDEYISRCKYHGFKIGIVPQSFVNHDRTCKAPDDWSCDANRIYVNNINAIINYKSSLKLNLVLFIKHYFDDFTDLLILRDFRKIKTLSDAFLKTIAMLKTINNTRLFFLRKNSPVVISVSDIL